MDIEIKNIHKWFGKVHANNGINLNLPGGTIQGILGENGAGKSTLMKVLSGFIRMDEGEILVDGKRIEITDPSSALRFGIGMLHQDPLDFPPMKVIDDFMLGQSGGISPNLKKSLREFRQLAQQFGFNLDPNTYVDMLTVGERQQLEILRLLWMGARVLILDEPTTGISSSQRIKLFETLRKLADQGMTVLFVSHKLEEIERLCQRVAVFRAGGGVGEIQSPFQTDELVKLMFGKTIPAERRTAVITNQVNYVLEDLAIEDYRLHIRNVNLETSGGEVIGLAGMEGSGQRQFLRTLGGLMRPVSGKILLGEKNLTGKPYHTFQEEGVYYVPAARLEEGLIPGLTLMDHFILAEQSTGFLINTERAKLISQERIDAFSIRGTAASLIEELSGGNQQRALLALLRPELRILLLEHPTRGLDIESARWIWSKLGQRCKDCTSIFFISSDLEEILQYSDRILVFFGGKVSPPIESSKATVEQLGQWIGGKGFLEREELILEQ
jgi:general nucleoside transport system ATP-binding protein